MEGTVPWAGRGYPEDDKFTALFDAAVDALTKVHEHGHQPVLRRADPRVCPGDRRSVPRRVEPGLQSSPGAGSLVALVLAPCP